MIYKITKINVFTLYNVVIFYSEELCMTVINISQNRYNNKILINIQISDGGKPTYTRTVEFEKRILNRIEDDSSTSTRKIAGEENTAHIIKFSRNIVTLYKP